MIFREGSFPSKLSYLTCDVDYTIYKKTTLGVEVDFTFDIISAYYSRRSKTEKFETPRITLNVICKDTGDYLNFEQYVNKMKVDLFYDCVRAWLNDLHNKKISSPESIVKFFTQKCVPYKASALNVKWEVVKTNTEPANYLNGYKL